MHNRVSYCREAILQVYSTCTDKTFPKLAVCL